MIPLLHEVLSRNVAVPMLHASRSLRTSQRTAFRAYRDGLAFRRQSRNWSTEQKLDWQLLELRRTVRYAWQTTTFYRERLDSIGFDPHANFGFDEYALLPTLEREDIQAASTTIRSNAVPESDLREDATGGSTGTPTRLWKGPLERGWSESGIEYFMERIGLPFGSRIALLWGHHLDPTIRAGWKDRLHDNLEAKRWYDCFRLDRDVLLRYHGDLQRWRPRGMVAYAGALASLAETLLQEGITNPTYPRSAFVTGAEKLFPHQREQIMTAFGRPIHERYGSRDVGLMGFQTDPMNSLAFSVDWANVILEPDGPASAEDTTAAILVTKLRADGMPMLRYRVGDVARFPTGARPGVPVHTLHEVVGRAMDRLWLPDGRWVHPVALPHLMKDFPIRDYQLHQLVDHSVTVLLVPAAGYSSQSGDSILNTLRTNLPGLSIEIEMVEEIPRGRSSKWRPVRSDINSPSGVSSA